MKLEFSGKKQFLYNVRELAKEKNISPQILLQEVMLDDLLDRISHSDYQRNFILKGGFLIGSMLGIDTRSTRDIDTSVMGMSVTKARMEEAFIEICAIELPEDIIDLRLRKIEDIREQDEYSGYRIYIDAIVYSTKVDIKVDISTGDVITEHAIKYGHKLLMEDRTINVLSYNIETIISEKLETIVSRMELNTRLKDFYDLYLYSIKQGNQVDFELLYKAMLATNQYRHSHVSLIDSIDVIKNLKINESMIKKWRLYQNKNGYAKNVKFEDTCDSAINLIEEAIEKASNN